MAMRALGRAAWVVACLCAAAGAARAQSYPTLASQPNPADFVGRADNVLTLAGDPMRFGGLSISWLGLRQDAGKPPRRPTAFEMRDALATASAMGARVVRLPGLAATAGCDLCLEPQAGTFSPEAFAQIDLALKQATDLGLRVIIPLADEGASCSGTQANGAICGETRLAGGAAGKSAFFTDARVRADFLARVRAIVTHHNSLTGTDYRDDPAILAWEDCDACGAGAPDAAVSAWVEAVGQTIKAEDHHHLFEDGAFAGRIARGAAGAVAPTLYSLPSVDIVGDSPVTGSDPKAARLLVEGTVAGMARTGRVYMIDRFGWSSTVWKTLGDLEAWLDDMARARALAGAITGDLQGHADQGGYLPALAPPGADGFASLYFPGVAASPTEKADMSERARALRRFNFAMVDVTVPPAFKLAPQPTVLSAHGGRVVWQGAAGAASYSVERSPDPGLPGTWTTLCDACTDDSAGFWQDPAPVKGPTYYRVMPLNVNGHRAAPSEAFRAD